VHELSVFVVSMLFAGLPFILILPLTAISFPPFWGCLQPQDSVRHSLHVLLTCWLWFYFMDQQLLPT
jgi:hypothetical protein